MQVLPGPPWQTLEADRVAYNSQTPQNPRTQQPSVKDAALETFIKTYVILGKPWLPANNKSRCK